jgi:PAS domain S-box-containing protein/putative nucleotidyltransferase with HDIG domain
VTVENLYAFLEVFFLPENMPKTEMLDELKKLRNKVSRLEASEKRLKILEQSLKKSEEMNKKIAMSSLDAIVITDAGGKIIFGTEKAAELYGCLSPDELTNRSAFDFIDATCHTSLKINLERVLAEGFMSGAEYTVIKKDGSKSFAEINSAVVSDPAGKPLFVVNTVRDVTKRKKMEEALVESTSKYRTLFECATDAIMVHEFSGNSGCGKILEINGEGCARLGITRQQAMTMSIGQAIGSEGRAAMMKAGKEMADTGHAVFEGVVAAKNGDLMVEINSHKIEYDGKAAVLSVVRDITEKKLAEEDLEKSYEMLTKIMNGIIQAMEKLVEKKDLYTVGHQKRTAELAGEIAMEMGLPKDQINSIYIAAVIHDIGKIFVSGSILNKKDKLTNEEYDIIKKHPEAGYEVLKSIEFPWPVAEIVLQHHERLNGSGYPFGLKGDDIYLESRIISVADVVEAITFERPYREAYGIDRALGELIKNRGRLYDPEIVDICVRLFRKKGYKLELKSDRAGFII